MDTLCAYLTPDAYLRLLRIIPLLGTLQIGFELIGAEEFVRLAQRTLGFQKRISAFDLQGRIRRPFVLYGKWIMLGALSIYENFFMLGGLFEDRSKEKSLRSVLDERRRMFSYLSDDKPSRPPLPSISGSHTGPLDRREPALLPSEPTSGRSVWMDDMLYSFSLDEVAEYGWRRHLALVALTLALVLLAQWLTPLGGLLESVRVLPAGHAWYERILHDMFWEFPLNIIGAVLTLALCAGILYTLGWVAQAVAQVALWLIAKPLQALAALLAHRRLYKALLAVTLLSTVLTALLPNEIKC